MAVKNNLTANNHRLGISAYLNQDAVKNKINEAVGKESGQRMITAIISATTANPALAECTNQSILSAAMVGEGLKLSPSPQLGQYYFVPYNNKNTGMKEAQFQIGYKAYIQLAIRSGNYRKLNVVDVKEGELISYNPFDEEIEVKPIENPEEREHALTIGYYAMFELNNGYRKAIYWSKEKMLAHADKFSMAFSKENYEKLLAGKIPQKDMWKYSSFWYKNFDGMAFKTMLRQLISKWGIMSIDMQSAYTADMAVIHKNENGTETYDYVETDEDVNFNVVEESDDTEESSEQPDAATSLFGKEGE